MNRGLLLSVFLAIPVLAAVDPAPAQTPESIREQLDAQQARPDLSAGKDAIFQRDGRQFLGEVLELRDGNVELRVVLPGGGTGEVSLPLDRIERIDFATPEAVEQVLENPGVEQIPALSRLWEQQRQFLPIPESPAAEVGLALAGQLLERSQPGDAESALQVFEQVEEQAWAFSARQLAKQGTLRALIMLDRAAEAAQAAREMLEQAEEPELILEANFIIGSSLKKQLELLFEENPRWRLDERVRPTIEDLYQEALNRFIYPSIFYGEYSRAAAQGLWQAVQIYDLFDEHLRAARRAYDLQELYPGTEFAALAGEYLQLHNFTQEELLANQPDSEMTPES